MESIFTLGPVLIAGGNMVSSDNTRSSLAKFVRFVRDKFRIRRMSSQRKRKSHSIIVL